MTSTIDISDFDCSDVGANAVVLTLTDGVGNVSSCQATVTVADPSLPTVICNDVLVQLDANGNASITTGMVSNGSYDNCDLSLSVSPSSFGCDDLGNNQVTLLGTSTTTGPDSCVATVTVSLAVELDTVDLATFTPETGMVIMGTVKSGWSGWAISELGDVNGDGTDDMIVSGYRVKVNGQTLSLIHI